MAAAAIVLAALAVILAWPVPVALAAARWPARAPGTALALWQAIALGGGLSMIGSLLLFGAIPFGDSLPHRLSSLWNSVTGGSLPPGATFGNVFALGVALLLTGHLLLNLAVTFVRADRQRRRHRYLVDLLSTPSADFPRTRVLDHEAPLAYCLPGATRSATVLSAGLLALLDERELTAVVAHEHAHLTQQHHLVLLVFRSWRGALPWFPIANRAENAVALLVEMLADDQARRVVDDRTLARAIALVGVGTEWGTDVDAGGGRQNGRANGIAALSATPDLAPLSTLVGPRVARLVSTGLPMPASASLSVLALSVALVALPTALLLSA